MASGVGRSEYGTFHVDRDDGHRDLDCYTRRHTVLLPADRKPRVGVDGPPNSGYVSAPGAAEQAKQDRGLRHLKGLAVYGDASALLNTYVAEVIPDPLRSQGLWSLAAHEGSPCVRLNVGKAEVLTVTHDGLVRIFVSGEGAFEYEMHAMLHKDYVERKDRIRVRQPPFVIGKHVPLRVAACESPKGAKALLRRKFVLDGAYWLVRELMLRQGPTYKKEHNRKLPSEVLAAAWRSSR